MFSSQAIGLSLEIRFHPLGVNPFSHRGPSCYTKNVSLEEQIRRQATALGFTLCGFTGVSPLPREQFFTSWLAQGHAGEMTYLGRNPQYRTDPVTYFPEAKSVICLGYPYSPPRLPDIDWRAELRGRIAAYAAGTDYHDIIQIKLKMFVSYLQETIPGLWAKPYVDTGPLFEREWAYRSGLGWFGKNTMLLHKGAGSWFFLAEVLVSVELEGDGIPQAHCGKCTQCLTDCPTGALEEGLVLKSPLCISYLTIEHRSAIPHELRPRMGNWIFGCDVCQEVCPWNKKFAQPRDDLVEELFPSLPELLTLDEAGFRARFGRSAIRRTKRRGLLRNVAIALGNSGNPEAIHSLRLALNDPEPLVRSHAAWALGQFDEISAREALYRHRDRETHAEVRAEVILALEQ
jgi:epoxyqueuosine reductase